MKFTSIFATALTVSLVSSSHAAVTLSSNNSGGGGRQITTAAGALLTTGQGSLRIGYFLDSSSPVIASGDWAAINAAFIPLGEGRAGLGDVTTPATAGDAPIPVPSAATSGRFSGQITGITGTNVAVDPPATGSSLSQGVRLFLFAANSPDPKVTPPTQFALVSDCVLWRAPKDDPNIPGGASITMAMNATNINVDDPANRMGNPLNDVFWGSIATVGAENFLRLAPPVPEPSTGLMALLAGLGLVVRRRR